MNPQVGKIRLVATRAAQLRFFLINFLFELPISKKFELCIFNARVNGPLQVGAAASG